MRRWAFTLVLGLLVALGAGLSACGETVNHQAATDCVPDCGSRSCGLDGCGGLCGECATGEFCTSGGVCSAVCVPDCSGRECGPDGCGGTCGADCLAPTPFCDPDGRCVDCLPDCTARTCGDDGCGGSCGQCDAMFVCLAEGVCCQPACDGIECGEDGCGGICGTCTGTTTCIGGLCQ